MFVRWKKRCTITRRGRFGWRHGHTSFAVQLVESVRRDGKPRQRVVAHLGRFHEGWDTTTCVRIGFAFKVRKTLHDLAASGAITAADADRFREQIAERVGIEIPRFDPVAAEAAEKAFREMLGKILPKRQDD